MMIILNFWIFNLSNIDLVIHYQTYINTPYKRNRNFQRFWKNKFKWKENKSQFYRIQDYVMHTKY